MNITINGRKVGHVHSIQKFYDYSIGPPVIKAVYIEGFYIDGGIFYCKSDIDNAEVIIDGEVISNQEYESILHTGEREDDMG